jgi:RNA polymerase-binding transcription factor DksA
MSPAKKTAGARKKAAAKPPAKVSSTKKAPVKKVAAAKKPPARKAPAKKVAAAKKPPAKKAPAKKVAAAKKPPARKAPAKAAVRKAAPAPKAPAVTKKAAPAAKAARKPGAPEAAPPAPKPPPKPTRGPYASDTKFLDEQRALLLEERVVYQRQAEDLRAEAESLALEREPGDVQFDEESGEGGTVAVDRERDLTLSAQALATIEEIDIALLAIESKMYGACEICGQPIPKARLRALPYARLCVGCKSGGLHRR